MGEFVIHLAMHEFVVGGRGDKAFYTTPMKALSNQKYRRACRRVRPRRGGLLTGDVTVNGDARIVVMTTEVLRNMPAADRQGELRDLRFVIMDEVHYLADCSAAAWRSTIVHSLPIR